MQGAVGAAYRQYLRVTKVLREYLEALKLVDKVRDEGAAIDSAVRKGCRSLTHLDSAFGFESERQDALFFIKAAPVHTKNNRNEKRHPGTSTIVPSSSLPPRSCTSSKTSTRRPLHPTGGHLGHALGSGAPDKDLFAVFEGCASQHYEPALSLPLRLERNPGCSCERPLSASCWRIVYTRSAPVAASDDG